MATPYSQHYNEAWDLYIERNMVNFLNSFNLDYYPPKIKLTFLQKFKKVLNY